MTSHASNELRGHLIELIDQLHASVRAEASKAGGEAMREAILRAAQAPDPPTAVETVATRVTAATTAHESLVG